MDEICQSGWGALAQPFSGELIGRVRVKQILQHHRGTPVWQMQVPMRCSIIIPSSCVSSEASSAAPHPMRLSVEQALSASGNLSSRCTLFWRIWKRINGTAAAHRQSGKLECTL